MSNKTSIQFFSEIPELKLLKDVEEPSSDWMSRITACTNQRPEKLNWRRRAQIYLENLFDLLYLPKPALSIPVLLLTGLLVAQLIPDTSPSSVQTTLFDTLLTGGRKI